MVNKVPDFIAVNSPNRDTTFGPGTSVVEAGLVPWDEFSASGNGASNFVLPIGEDRAPRRDMARFDAGGR